MFKRGVTGLGILQHLSCIDEHIGPPIVHTLNGKRLHFTTRTEARRVQTRCKPTRTAEMSAIGNDADRDA